MQRYSDAVGQLKKKTMKFLLVAFSFLLLLSSCSKNSGSRLNKLCFTRTATNLKVENNTNKIIYYAAFGEEILPLIDWAPSCTNNNVAAQSSITKELSTIAGYVEKDKLVVYWWQCNGNTNGEIHTLSLHKNQVECQE